MQRATSSDQSKIARPQWGLDHDTSRHRMGDDPLDAQLRRHGLYLAAVPGALPVDEEGARRLGPAVAARLEHLMDGRPVFATRLADMDGRPREVRFLVGTLITMGEAVCGPVWMIDGPLQPVYAEVGALSHGAGCAICAAHPTAADRVVTRTASGWLRNLISRPVTT